MQQICVLYLQELNFHVEECLSRNLHVRCSGFVRNVLRTCVQHMSGNERLLACFCHSLIYCTVYVRHMALICWQLMRTFHRNDFQVLMEHKNVVGLVLCSQSEYLANWSIGSRHSCLLCVLYRLHVLC